jgi:glycine cleavage system transcriptional repressor
MRRMTTTPAPEVFLVLSCLGPDRTGIVAEVTHYLTERGANVEDSRMAVLGGEFGILLLASGPPGAIEAVERETESLTRATGLTVQSRRTKSPESHRRAATIPCVISVDALDHEGIVRAVSRALHGVGVNIVSLETSAYEAPVTGSQLFRMEARVDVPAGVTVTQLRKAMDAVAETENLDIDVRSLIKG